MNKTYGFLYQTNSQTDRGYREVQGECFEAARLEWQRQVTAEEQTVRLDAAQDFPPSSNGAY